MNRKYFHLVSGGLVSLLLALAPLPAIGQDSLEIPSGTSIRVRMIDSLSSEQSQVGDTFTPPWTNRFESMAGNFIPRARMSSVESRMCIPQAGSANPANSTWC